MARIKRPAMKRQSVVLAEKRRSVLGQWNEMQYDVLLKMFATFNIMDIILRFSTVCRTWRSVCSDPVIWKNRTLDLSQLSNYFRVPPLPYFGSEAISARRLLLILKNAMNLSQGNFITLIFHFYISITDEHLLYSARRCPKVKKLVLPGWNFISLKGFTMALNSWRELECLIVASIESPHDIMKTIAGHCKNFSELKVMSPIDLEFATSITTFLPGLKVLSVRCSILHNNALIHILDNLEHLEVLNITHCLLINIPTKFTEPTYVYRDLGPILLQKASRLREFYTCEKRTCFICNRSFVDDDGNLEWHDYGDELWRTDEVPSLAY